MRFRIYTAASLDIDQHLATESLLLDRATEASPALYLWRSRNAMVIGKNQNPWQECHVPRVLRSGMVVARRISGGGAVYHDEGNLNYAFFMPRTLYDAEAIYAVIARVLEPWGLNVERMNRTSLAVNGFKFSGNAFCLRRQAAMHHGTLLVDADLDRLRWALRPPEWRIESRATPSVPAPVKNLVDWCPDLDWAKLVEAFHRCCGDDQPISEIGAHDGAADDTARRAGREPDWVYGRSPPFTIRFGESESSSPGDTWQATVEKDRVMAIDAPANARPWLRVGERFSDAMQKKQWDLPASQPR